MSFIQNFFTSRDNNTDGNTYVGQEGRLWYNPNTNSIYVNTANIPGGTPVAFALGANIIADDIALNSLTARTGTITINGDILLTGSANIIGNISPASNVKVGGIKAGPGVNIANDGTLTIDAANTPLSFGDFTATNNILTIVNVDEDMILATQGNAEIQLVGNVGFYKTDGLPPDSANLYAFFNNDGQATFYVPDADPLAGAFKIVGSNSRQFSSPLNTGVMLQITGQNNDASRLYNDSIGSFAAFVGRRINGLVSAPTAVLAGDEIIRISSTGYDGTSIPGGGTARIVFQAMENYTPTARGSNLSFWATAVGSNVLTQIANVTVANGMSATRFTTSGNISAAGNITGGNIFGTTVSAVGNVTAGNVTTVGTISATGNITTAGFFVGNGFGITDINSFGNVYANGVAVLATSGSSTLVVTPGNNINIQGDNGLKSVTISVSSAPSFVGNVTGGNIVTAGRISATGNIVTQANIVTPGTVINSSVSTTGNVVGANLITSGQITATGNVTGNYIIGNGTQLTGINSFGNVFANGVAILAGATSSTITVTPGNNQVITGNNTSKVLTLAVSDNPTFNNVSVTGNIIVSGNINTGNTTYLSNVANIVFANTILNTAVPGQMEYDGRVLYFTAQDQERGVIPSQQWYVLNVDRGLTFATTAPQSLFGVGAHVSNSTRYFFRIKATVSRADGTNNTAFTLGWRGTATLNKLAYTVNNSIGIVNTATISYQYENVLVSNFTNQATITTTSNPPDSVALVINGIIDVGAAGAGYVDPYISWTGAIAPGAVVVASTSNFQLYPIGLIGSNTVVGNWA